MSENPAEAAASTPPPATPEPAAAAPSEPAPPTAKRSLEDLLGALDDDARSVVLGEVSKARNEAKNLRDRFKEAEPKLTEYERLVEASKSDLQKAQEAADRESTRATSLLSRAVKAEVRALAADSFADPDDAASVLDAAKYATADGDVDIEAIRADLADLLERKPHWAKSGTLRPGMKPNPAQGSSAGPPLTIGQQIAAATQAGDLRTAMRLKASQALNSST